MAGTLVSYLPFTRSVTEDLSGKEWTVTGNPQIITHVDSPSFAAAKFETGESITSPSLLFKKAMAFCLDFFIYIPNTGTKHLLLDMPTSNGFISSIHVLESGKLRLYYNNQDDFSGTVGWIKDTSNTYTNRWINLRLCYNTFQSPLSIYLYINPYIDDDGHRREEEEIYINLSSYRNDIQASIYLGNGCLFNKFRLYTKSYSYGVLSLPTEHSTMTFDKSIEQEFLVTNTVYFESLASINLKTYNKSLQWYYKNIGTADGLLVSGTSLTNVSPLKSVTSKAFYQTNRAKCFDTQASKEIYMLFDIYFDGTKRWRAYEESSTNGVTGITAQTSGELSIFSNNVQVGASTLTINKLETYLLYMKSDATNGYIEVWKDGEWKYTYIGNVNNGDDFSNLELQSDGAGTVFSNIVISNQSIYDYDRWTGNYTTIQRTLTNETWVKERCLKALLPPFQKMDLCGHEWTAVGNPKIQDGKLYLDGSSYLQMAEKFAFTGQPFTVSLKFSTTNVPGSTSLCLWLMYVSTYDRIQLSTNSSKQLALWKDSDSTLWLRTSFSVIDGQEHHAECSFDGSTWYLFLDGVLIGSKVLTCPDKQYTLYIGYNPANGSHFKGSISNFQIYDGVALHTENFTPPTTEDYTTYKQQLTSDNTLKNHLMSWLSFDPSTDLCGNTWTITDTAPTITNINELNGKATQFGKGYIYTNPPELKNNHFTIDFWEYIPSTINGLTGELVTIDGTDGTNTQCLNIVYDAGATVPSLWLGKGTKSGWIYSNKIIGTKIRDQWVHRAVVRYNDKIYAFENGNLYTSFDIEPGFYIEVTDSSLFIGGFKRASRLFPGMLSEVRVYVGTALWTTNFTPLTQEDYFETYWYFNKPAPVVYLGSILRELTNASKIWKYINPGYMDLCSGTDDTGYISSIITNDSDVPVYFTNNRGINQSAFITLTNVKYPTDAEIWVKWSKPSTSTNAFYTIRIIDENGESIEFIANSGGTVSHPLATLSSLTQSFKISPITEAATYILHVKSHPTRGIIELFENNQLIGELTGDIQDGAKLSHIDVVIDNNITNGNLYNFIISNGGLADKDTIAHNINPVQRSIINNEEWRIARYCLKSWMLFDESPTKDLCGNTWTAYNNPSIIDTDVLHGKALQLNSGQYLSMPNTISLGGDKDYTICGWYKMSSSSGTWAPIFVFYQKANAGPLIKISRNGSTSGYAWGDPDGTYALGSSIDSNLCYFTIIYIAHSARFIIYLDGKMIVNAGINNTNRYDYKLYIGKSNYNDGPYIGTVNEFKVYDGVALYDPSVTEFTPPIHQATDDKLYYDKSAETMKFDYFADVQKTNWKLSVLTTNKVIVSYLPFDDSIEDICGNSTEKAIDNKDLVFNSTDSIKNKSLQISGSTFNAVKLTLPLQGKSFVSQFYIYGEFTGDRRQSTQGIFALRKNDSAYLYNLYLDEYFGCFYINSISVKDKNLISNTDRLFLITVIYNQDTSTITTIIQNNNLSIVSQSLSLSNTPYNIEIGSNTGISSAMMFIDEFKVYIDYTDDMVDTIIDKNIEVRFNNGEESVYFEFYANTNLGMAEYYLNIAIPNRIFWADLSLIDGIKVLGQRPYAFQIGSKVQADHPSSDPSLFDHANDSCVRKIHNMYQDNEYVIKTIVAWTLVGNIGDARSFTITNTPFISLKFTNNTLSLVCSSNTLFTTSIMKDYIYHVAVVVDCPKLNFYFNGRLVYSDTTTVTLDTEIEITSGENDDELYFAGLGYYSTNIFDTPNEINLGQIGQPPSYKIPLYPFRQAGPKLVVWHNNSQKFNQLVLPTDPNASSIRIYHDNTVYALSK